MVKKNLPELHCSIGSESFIRFNFDSAVKEVERRLTPHSIGTKAFIYEAKELVFFALKVRE